MAVTLQPIPIHIEPNAVRVLPDTGAGLLTALARPHSDGSTTGD